ncbi:NAD-dependent protein deacetylase [Thermoproteus tenax]|uniref:NAD-dependent protein deacylase n=1 Tax=Thermoproteus tenax (strain ATCC 35583 / DSM 2078 / JCM 9277 / NBRC 100435 / Kra 1) TaxID=768679 RepID=G4RLW2_THETK|nr:NAD-dependent protein deacetylase [Thermoproteus tenax]CCC82557.1 transcriptional regulatory protein, Sir2 homolog [Thermoproteus tenax Kra 1]
MIELARALARSSYAVAFTGAGVSADSGIPTFRGPGGLWSRYRPEELATPEAFLRDPLLVWEWYKWRQELIYRAAPNPAHIALAKLEKMGIIKSIITQNVDGLHERAGSQTVVELHGNIWRLRCIRCGATMTTERPVDVIPPRCPRCGGLMRPDVVWFGERLPAGEWEKAVDHASRADIMLVVGTSGAVFPAAYLPRLAKDRGAKIAVIDPGDTAFDDIADFRVRERAGEALPKLVEYVEAILRGSL